MWRRRVGLGECLALGWGHGSNWMPGLEMGETEGFGSGLWGGTEGFGKGESMSKSCG